MHTRSVTPSRAAMRDHAARVRAPKDVGGITGPSRG